MSIYGFVKIVFPLLFAAIYQPLPLGSYLSFSGVNVLPFEP